MWSLPIRLRTCRWRRTDEHDEQNERSIETKNPQNIAFRGFELCCFLSLWSRWGPNLICNVLKLSLLWVIDFVTHRITSGTNPSNTNILNECLLSIKIRKGAYNSPSSAKEKYPSLITIMWSSNWTSRSLPPSLIFFVNSMSAWLAVRFPDGNLRASQLDIGLIRKLKESGKFIEIQVLDHLIVASEGYPVHNALLRAFLYLGRI